MRAFSRFERRLIGAMSFVALATLAAALLLGRAALVDAYRVGVNPAVRAQLEEGVESHRAHLEALRREAETIADAIAFHRDFPGARGSTEPRDTFSRRRSPDDPAPTELGGFDDAPDEVSERAPAFDEASEAAPAFDEASAADFETFFRHALARYPSVGALALHVDGEERVRVEERARLDPERTRPVTLFRPVGERHRIEVVATAPAALFAALQSAGEEAEFFSRLDARAGLVSGAYVWVYLGFLVLVVGAALALAAVLGRRVTGRVTTLAVAVRDVGRGDLSVHVPTEGNDEIRELTDAFNSMVRDLRESRARIDYLQRIGAWQEFARRLAHEIKNPLTPIQLAAQEMHRSYGGDDARYRRKLDDACGIIEEEVETLRRLVSEFSSFARLPTADLAAADLADFVRESERSLAAVQEDVGVGVASTHEDAGQSVAPVSLELVAPSHPMPVLIDAMMLKRCLDNLVRNALQALRGRVRGGKVRVEARAVEAGYELRVEDDGPGIPERDRDAIFDPYFTTKGDGTGLGLAIVKKVVLEHGGEIRCEGSPLGGAAFVITLPATEG